LPLQHGTSLPVSPSETRLYCERKTLQQRFG
jgi:hypothetical protein